MRMLRWNGSSASSEQRPRGDSGMTLTELLVSMGILVVVLAVFMAGVVSMSRTTVRAEVATTANDQFRKLFQHMDREVRYATDINRPGVGPGGTVYIEYRYVNEGADAVPTCVQMRLVPSREVLERRTWPEGNPGAVTDWDIYVTRIRNDLTAPNEQPFVFQRAGLDASSNISYVNQRLTVHLDSGLGESNDGRGSQLITTFVARNSNDQSQSNTDSNGDGVTDRPVCLTGVTRS